jgi:hypothetical protein
MDESAMLMHVYGFPPKARACHGLKLTFPFTADDSLLEKKKFSWCLRRSVILPNNIALRIVK